MLTEHYQFIVLVERFYQFSDQSKSWLLMLLFILDGNLYMQRISDKYRFDESEPFIAIGHGYFVDKVSGKTDGHGKNQRAVCNPLFKGLGFTPLFIHMMR